MKQREIAQMRRNARNKGNRQNDCAFTDEGKSPSDLSCLAAQLPCHARSLLPTGRSKATVRPDARRGVAFGKAVVENAEAVRKRDGEQRRPKVRAAACREGEDVQRRVIRNGVEWFAQACSEAFTGKLGLQ